MLFYKRTTRRCSFGQLRPEMIAAIRARVAEAEMGDVEASLLMCCEVAAEKQKARGLRLPGSDPDPDRSHHLGIVLTPEWLIWCRSGPKAGVSVSAARLRDIEVRDLQDEFKGSRVSMEDTGVSVFGFVNRSAERVTAFIGLGPDAAGEALRAALRQAVAAARQAG